MFLYVLVEYIHEHKVCVGENNETEIEQKSNHMLWFVFSKVRAVGIEFCYGKICNLKSESNKQMPFAWNELNFQYCFVSIFK